MMKRVFNPRYFLIWLSLVVQCLTARAESPRIVPVRVPAKSVDAWFPPGTPIRSLDYAEFEKLMDRVKLTERFKKNQNRLISARHSIVWRKAFLLAVLS